MKTGLVDVVKDDVYSADEDVGMLEGPDEKEMLALEEV